MYWQKDEVQQHNFAEQSREMHTMIFMWVFKNPLRILLEPLKGIVHSFRSIVLIFAK